MSDFSALDTGDEQAFRRAVTYKFLAECFRDPRDGLFDFLDDVDPESLLNVAGNALIELARDAREQLRVEHARLFVGPFDVPAVPYGSVYLDDEDRLMTASTLDVSRRFENEGLEYGFDGPPDHITAELEFMYYLSAQEANARREDDRERASFYRGNQRSFLEDHLSRWIGEFCENVISNAGTTFYSKLGEETRRFVKADHRRLIEDREVENGSPSVR